MDACCDRLCWTLQKTAQMISLNLEWPIPVGDNRVFSKYAKSSDTTLNCDHSAMPASMESTDAEYKKVTRTRRKSPSQKKRDRQRYEDWKHRITVCSTDSPSTQPQTEECQQDSPVELKSVEPTDIQQRNDAIQESLDSQDSHVYTRSMTANIETSS